MHNFVERTSVFFGFFSTCLVWYFVFVFLFDFILRTEDPIVAFKANEVSFSYGKEDGFVRRRDRLLQMGFDLEIDFSKTTTWNTKNIFAYLSVEYQTDRMTKNEIVIWDRILGKNKWTSSDKNIKQKYRKNDVVRNGFGQKEAVVKLCWSTTPHVGLVKKREKILQAIQLPVE